MSENRDTVSGRACATLAEVAAPGDFHIYPAAVEPDGLYFMQVCLPGGACVWGWDGNREQPTLVPSIHHVDVWHGHLQAGVFKSV